MLKPIISSILVLYLLTLPITSLAQEAEQEKTESATENTQSEQKSDENSAAKKRAESISPPKDMFAQHNEDLKHYLDKTQELLVGTDSYTMLWEESRTANHRGVIIIIPDWQQPATTPKTTDFLFHEFPDHGWSSLVIQPPNMPTGYPSMATNDTENSEQNKKIIDDYKKQLSSLYEQIIQKIENKPGAFIVVSQGNHAGLLLDLLEAGDNKMPHGLIMLSAYRSTDEEDMAFAKTLSMSDLPVLDLMLAKDHPLVAKSADYRRKFASNEMKAEYRQKQFVNLYAGDYPQVDMFKTIQGWLRSIGW